MVEMGGRRCLTGTAHLEGVDFADGVMEVDLWMTGRRRSYPGFQFRRQGPGEREEVYLRPHRAPFYDDAVQYTPVFHGTSGWQLYNGDGYTAAADIPVDTWVRLSLEVSGDRARVRLGEGGGPVLTIPHLQRGVSKGTIGVTDAVIGNACFSNFSFSDSRMPAIEAPPADHPPGVFSAWQLSPVFGEGEIAGDDLPSSGKLSAIEWLDVAADERGLVDVSRYRDRTGGGPRTVLARTKISSPAERIARLQLGYSDRVAVFLNRQIVYSGDNGYRSRESSYLGVVGPYDTLFLPLREGDNELVLRLEDLTGGWGFLVRDGDAVFLATGVTERWTSPGGFRTPESAIFDADRQAIYVSNFDAYNPSLGAGLQSISKLGTDGRQVDLEWVTGLVNPTGLAMAGGRLFVVERSGLAEIDPDSASIVARHRAPEPGFLNDAASDSRGRIYVSDSARNRILRWSEGAFEVWLEDSRIQRPNGVHVDGDRLLVGCNGDRRIKAVDLATGEISTVASLGAGIIDGIDTDARGNLLVSHNEGRVYRIARDGRVEKIVDTTVVGRLSADFVWVPELELLVVPTFTDNRVVAYRLGDG